MFLRSNSFANPEPPVGLALVRLPYRSDPWWPPSENLTPLGLSASERNSALDPVPELDHLFSTGKKLRASRNPTPLSARLRAGDSTIPGGFEAVKRYREADRLDS
jgi:hypothetical protein